MTSILEEELAALKGKDLYRKIRSLSNVRGNRATLDGKEVLLFCGNDYLGLSRHPRVIRALEETVRQYGVGSGAARLISGGTDLHEKLEQKIAAFKKKEKALLFTTGYQANLGVLTSVAGEDDLIVMDKLCHASVVDGARLSGATLRVFPHLNYARCEEILKQNQDYDKRILVTDTVFSMDGDLADLRKLVWLKEEYGCLLAVDDAHATGVLGRDGRGAYEDGGLVEKMDVIVGTLSKGIGCLGGFAATSQTLYDYFVNAARSFIFDTSLPPALCAAACEAISVIEEEPDLRARLWRNIHAVHSGLKKEGFDLPASESPILPIILGGEKEALRASNLLFEQGILIPAIRYPTVSKGKARLRLTVNAACSEPEKERLFAAFRLIKDRIFSYNT